MSSAWVDAPDGERGFAMRSIAGALSRLLPVDVMVRGTPGPARPDGAFGTFALGEASSPGAWPGPSDAVAPTSGSPRAAGAYRVALVDADDPEAVALAGTLFPGAVMASVGASDDAGVTDASVLTVDARSSSRPGMRRVGLYARAPSGAARRMHFTVSSVPPYLLVLGDRGGAAPDGVAPTERIRWMLARFARRHLVLVEQGAAGLWRSRSQQRHFGLHTRMDLWQLLAHAWLTVDLRPGALFARECVESLLYGVPVIAPAGSAAAPLAGAGAALLFEDTVGLLSCVEELLDPACRDAVAAHGLELVHPWYGDPAALVARLATVMDELGVTGATRAPG